MAWAPESSWNPTRLTAVAASADTSTGATEVMTDAGRAYIKPMGNRQGPHVLATDWVGTLLAKWFGLSTFEIAILTLQDDDVFDLPRGAQPGPAFAAKAMAGDPWSRSGTQLDLLVNPEDITRLVVFDTWTRNCDRHHPDRTVRRPNYDNVYLSSEGVEPGRRRLIAMDHGLCFIRSGEDLTARLSNIDRVKDPQVYGLFPEFRGRLLTATIDGCASQLRKMDGNTAEKMVDTVPAAWDVSPDARKAWTELICQRAGFVADNVHERIEAVAPWFGAPGEQDMARGFYSVVQYCPDRFRAEAVNVGLVLLCVDPHAVRVKMTGKHDRVRRLFAIGKSDLKHVKLSTHGLASRIERSVDDLRTQEDLATFAASRANDLRLTEPRLAKLDDIDDDLERLFAQLVEQRSSADLAEASPAEVLPPRLGEVFYRLQQARKIWQPGTITVPVYKRKFDIPYAYKNGVVNLIKPHVFPATKRAETQAATLAVNGDLIRKHPVEGEKQQLIVVSTQETPEQAQEVSEHVEPLFREYGVRLIRPQDADAFAHEVEQSAH